MAKATRRRRAQFGKSVLKGPAKLVLMGVLFALWLELGDTKKKEQLYFLVGAFVLIIIAYLIQWFASPSRSMESASFDTHRRR